MSYRLHEDAALEEVIKSSPLTMAVRKGFRHGCVLRSCRRLRACGRFQLRIIILAQAIETGVLTPDDKVELLEAFGTRRDARLRVDPVLRIRRPTLADVGWATGRRRGGGGSAAVTCSRRRDSYRAGSSIRYKCVALRSKSAWPATASDASVEPSISLIASSTYLSPGWTTVVRPSSLVK